ncbi:2-dehydropantoate 2-reductase [Marinobacter confluentis]|uniref:2-dehydropantoate 2-reductase n=1 Tax=Marinobacter confluentis TaxID=1697557 RepID=A0A4Z1BXS8_9GAMM|nr:2-dehydropantoate 2-reductase [Marinobacter confluentis]
MAILGAGSLGQLWAGYLPAGSAVFLSRASFSPRGSDEPSTFQYQLKRPDGYEIGRRIPVLAVSAICPSLLLVTTKAGDTLNALRKVLPEIPEDVPVVLFQNGMGCQQTIADLWPDRPILAAATTEGANRPETGITIHAGRGETWIGGLTTRARDCVNPVVQRLSDSGLIIHAETDIRQRLWDKLVVNAGINAFTAILDCPNGEILNHPFFLEHIDPLSEEIGRVMATEASHPLSAADIKARIQAVATSTAKNTSSMRGDRQRGRKTEIDVINGYIAERGQAKGIATPVNQLLVRQVKELTE